MAVRPSFVLIFTTIALHATLFWPCGSSQKPGFLSIDCGSDAASNYIDDNKIQWISDSNLINEGRSTPVSGANDILLSTMRLFDGNQSKYCYSLTNTAGEAEAFFMVRARFWAGVTPPYTPKHADNKIRFKMIVDANEWTDVVLLYGSTDSQSYDMYMRAQRRSIDVCLARITSDGDAPFISSLELRPLPSTLTTTKFMSLTNVILIAQGHLDYGQHVVGPSSTRYSLDPLDRIWTSSMPPSTNLRSTETQIDTSKDIDQLPQRILQDSIFSKTTTLTLTWNGLDVNSMLYVVFHFAEISPAVNASGQRVFNIMSNGDGLLNTDGALDVFALVGGNTSYSLGATVSSNSTGAIAFEFLPTASSPRLPEVAAGELFSTKASRVVTSTIIVHVVESIKTSLGLSSYTGDPCLPTGYGYSWLNCSANGAGIMTLSLSNYGTGHEIPGVINELTNLTEVYLDGNGLQGQIPDLSALVNLEILDLRNNKLSGFIPEFLATLKNLKALYLQNNNFSGVIPAALLERKHASLLTFEFSGNPVLCKSNGGECPKSTRSSTGMIIGVVIAGILLVGIAIGIAVYRRCCRKRQSPTGHFDSSAQHELPQVREIPSPVINMPVSKLSVREFSFLEIRNATNNFHTQLGQGGFGPVYKGCLEDGRIVAIKVASNSSHQGLKEFLNEVDLLSRVHHKNLVDLVGFCNDEKLVLVYEFMSNGSLYDCLHGKHSKDSPLSWAARMRIIVDAAQGLDYLHDGCKPQIIHRDIKSSNILLSDQMDAKISDFGISRNYIRDETGAPMTALMGSTGYMDPEYLSNLRVTEGIDVYSFGVLLFEVVSGRTAVCKDSSEHISIVEWAKAYINRGKIDDIVDASLHGRYDAASAWKVLEVALACVELPSSKRPKMSDVYQELKEAKRMALEGRDKTLIDTPSTEFADGHNVTAR